MINQYFTERRSIRNFQKREISQELLKSIITAAAKAPTCGNMQLYTVIVTRDEERKNALSAYHFNQPACGAPVLLTVCADFNRFTKWCTINNADAGYDNFLSFTSAVADAMIFAQQICTIAEMEGLGTCYLGTVTYNAPEIASLLKLPDLVMPIACIALGYPDGEGVETERLPLEAILHEEEYRPDNDEAIKELFRVKDEYPANQPFIAENGKDNLAQVFAEVRYPRNMNEEFSDKLQRWLKETWFKSASGTLD